MARTSETNVEGALEALSALQATLPRAVVAIQGWRAERAKDEEQLTEELARVAADGAAAVDELDERLGGQLAEERARLGRETAERQARIREIRSKFGFVIGTITERSPAR